MSSFEDNVEALFWLQGNCYDRLTKWEQGFVDELCERLDHGKIRQFTSKQDAVVDRMWEQYVVRKRT